MNKIKIIYYTILYSASIATYPVISCTCECECLFGYRAATGTTQSNSVQPAAIGAPAQEVMHSPIPANYPASADQPGYELQNVHGSDSPGSLPQVPTGNSEESFSFSPDPTIDYAPSNESTDPDLDVNTDSYDSEVSGSDIDCISHIKSDGIDLAGVANHLLGYLRRLQLGGGQISKDMKRINPTSDRTLYKYILTNDYLQIQLILPNLDWVERQIEIGTNLNVDQRLVAFANMCAVEWQSLNNGDLLFRVYDIGSDSEGSLLDDDDMIPHSATDPIAPPII